MPELTADQAHVFVHHVLMPVVKAESRTTRSVIAAVPNRNLDYRPDPHAKSANELLRHIASADNFFLKSVIDGAFVPGSITIPQPVTTPADVAEWYSNAHATNFDTLAALPGANLVKILDFRGLFRAPAFAFILSGLTHAVHHRGQLSTYLRAMGGKVPAIYGESYDSAAAREAARTQA